MASQDLIDFGDDEGSSDGVVKSKPLNIDPTNTNFLDLDDSDDVLQPALLPISTGVKGAAPKSPHHGQLIDLADKVEQTQSDTRFTMLYTIAEEPEPGILSEGEEEPEISRARSASKVLPWNDGSEGRKTKSANVRHEVTKPSRMCAKVAGSKQQDSRSIKRTSEVLKHNCLGNEEDLPQSSLLSLQHRTTLKPQQTATTKKSFAEAVSRTYDPITDTVKVSAIRQKRKGRGKQPSYYNITPELYYLR